MPDSTTSRYFEADIRKWTAPDGAEVAYLSRRFCPMGETLPLLTIRHVRDGDRLDNIAASQLGESQLFWRIADANDAMNPRDLLRPLARPLRIPIPEI